MKSELLSLYCNDKNLEGVLLNPSSETLIYLIGGSGNADRDGVSNNARLGYQEWAEAIAWHGFATFRADRYDRAKDLKTEYEQSDYAQILKQDLEWVKFLTARFKTIYILGHSLGGIFALDIATKLPVTGVFLVATAAKSFVELLERQFKQLANSFQDKATSDEVLRIHLAILAYWLDLAPLKNISHEASEVAAKSQKHYISSLFPMMGAEMIKQLNHKAIFILQGKLDWNVEWQDAEILSDNAPLTNFTSLTISDNRNHLLRLEGEATAENAAAFIAKWVSDSLTKINQGKPYQLKY